MTPADPTTETCIGYLSQSRLFVKAPGKAEEEVVSSFAEGLKQRLKSVEDRASFRNGSGAQFMRGGLPTAPLPNIEETFRYEFSCASAGVLPGRFCYAIEAQGVRGLFSYELAEKYERRVLHGPKHLFTAISARAGDEGEDWLVAVAQDHGASVIGLFKPDAGGGVRELTEGDSIDSYPAWEANGRKFVYQTCGIARHPRTGMWMGLGPASIHRIDLESGKMDAVVEDDRFDFLCPSTGQDGCLYFLKRPYEPFQRGSVWRTLQDIVLFPFRLGRAIFGFLNVFSMFFSNKPLQTSGSPQNRAAADPKAIFLHGRLVQVDQAMRDALVDELASVVPGSWELMRRSAEGETKMVAAGVMAYSVGADGSVIYSNGRSVFRLAKDGGKPVKVSDRKFVTTVFTF